MNFEKFFLTNQSAPDGFGDTRQGIFGQITAEGNRYITDGYQVIQVSPTEYQLAEYAFGQAYDNDLESNAELEMWKNIYFN